VVLVILALLVALTLPVVRMVRESARSAECANNQRSTGLMHEAYASDHRGMLPPAYLRGTWDSSSMSWLGSSPEAVYGVHGEGAYGIAWDHWAAYLMQYNESDQFNNAWAPYLPSWREAGKRMALVKVWTCPSAPNKPVRGSFKEHEMAVASYGPNTALLGDHSGTGSNQGGWANHDKGVSGWPGYGVGIPGFRDNARRRARLPKPTQTILMAEHRGNPYDDPQFTYWTDAPFARLPVDGTGAQLTPPSSFGTPTLGWSGDGWDGWALRVSHRGRSTYLFHDGHVEVLTPWETCTANPAVENMWTGL
jgi:prepilin-type processing-associated H-X9-DG protein